MGERRPPRVSILMPAFNAAPWIERALASALAQSEADLEILVIDDASTDATARLAGDVAARDSRVRVIHVPRNGGPAASRNTGLAQARGDWIALLDADDRYHPHRLATLLALAQAKGADIVSDNLLLCDEPARGAAGQPMIPPGRWRTPFPLSTAGFIEGNIGHRRQPRVSFGFMQPMFRAQFLRDGALRYDARNRFGEDFLLSVACLMRGAIWWVTPEPLYFYTIRPGSLTHIQSAADLRRISDMEAALLAAPGLPPNSALATILRRHKACIDQRYHYRLFTDLVKDGAWGTAAAHLFSGRRTLAQIGRELIAQTPAILGKAVQGGYARRPGLAANLSRAKQSDSPGPDPA